MSTDYRREKEDRLLSDVSVESNPRTINFSYDADGNLTEILITDKKTGKKKKKTFTYDASGNLTKIEEEWVT